MARIQPAAAATKEAEKVFREIEGAFGMVPNLFKTYAVHPPLLEANWNKVKAVMMEGSLSGKVKQSIAVLVSKDNGCQYCVAAHRGALKAIGVSDEELRQIEENVAKADFTAKEKALIDFARKANRAPLSITDADFAAVKQTGASDAEIIEALGVMEVFTSFNKFLDSLQVAIDF
jgi:uncharacterized peroxidase-related enzyme